MTEEIRHTTNGASAEGTPQADPAAPQQNPATLEHTPPREPDAKYPEGVRRATDLEAKNADSPDVEPPDDSATMQRPATTAHPPGGYGARFAGLSIQPLSSAAVDPDTAPADAKYPDVARRLTLYIGNLPRASEEVEQILHRFLISLGLDDYKILSLQPCFHKKDKRQFAKIKVGSEVDRLKLLEKNYAFLFNRFIMVGPKNDLITGASGKVCRTCGWNYMSATHAKDSKTFRFLCAECLRSRLILEEMKSRVSVDFRLMKEGIVAVLEQNHIHPHNIHRRLYLSPCPRKVCRKVGCNFAHNRRQQYLGQVVNDYRQIDKDMASMPIVTSQSASRSASRSESPGRPAQETVNNLAPCHPVEETINGGLRPSEEIVNHPPEEAAPRFSHSASPGSTDKSLWASSSARAGARPSMSKPGSRSSFGVLQKPPSQRDSPKSISSGHASDHSLCVETGSTDMTKDHLEDVPETNGMRSRTTDLPSPALHTAPSGTGLPAPPPSDGDNKPYRRRKFSRSRGRSPNRRSPWNNNPDSGFGANPNFRDNPGNNERNY